MATVVVVRGGPEVSGYPRIAGGSLHIAHLLWGGLLMLAAALLLLTYLSRPMMRLGAVLAGVGFGLFIDELGKFITADNDYFFRPAERHHIDTDRSMVEHLLGDRDRRHEWPGRAAS